MRSHFATASPAGLILRFVQPNSINLKRIKKGGLEFSLPFELCRRALKAARTLLEVGDVLEDHADAAHFSVHTLHIYRAEADQLGLALDGIFEFLTANGLTQL